MTIFNSLFKQSQSTSLGQTLNLFSQQNMPYEQWKEFLDRLPWDEIFMKPNQNGISLPAILIASQIPEVLTYFQKEHIIFLDNTNQSDLEVIFQQSLIVAIGLNRQELLAPLIKGFKANPNNYSACWSFLKKNDGKKSWLISALVDSDQSGEDVKKLCSSLLDLINPENQQGFNTDFWGKVLEQACEDGKMPLVEALLKGPFSKLTEADWCRVIDSGEILWAFDYVEKIDQKFDQSRANSFEGFDTFKSYAELILKSLNSSILDDRAPYSYVDKVAEKLLSWKGNPKWRSFHLDDRERQYLLYPNLIRFSENIERWKPLFVAPLSCEELKSWIISNNRVESFQDRIESVMGASEQEKQKFQMAWVRFVEKENFYSYYANTSDDAKVYKAALVSHLLETDSLFKNKDYESSNWQSIKWLQALSKAEKQVLEQNTLLSLTPNRSKIRL